MEAHDLPPTPQRPAHDAAESERYVYCELPRCPKCEGLALKTTRSIKQDDDTRMQYVRCLDNKCKHAFRIIWE